MRFTRYLAVAVLLLCQWAFGAINFVTSATAADNTTTATSLPITITIASGDCIVVGVSRGGNVAVGTVTDDGGNTYTQKQQQTAAPRTSIFTSIATASATTITVNFTAGVKTVALAGKFSGVASIGTNTNLTTGTDTNPTATGTLADAANWMVAVIGVTGKKTLVAQTGNLRTQIVNNTSGSTSGLVDNTGSTSPVCSATYTTATGWGDAWVELVPSAGAAALCTLALMGAGPC